MFFRRVKRLSFINLNDYLRLCFHCTRASQLTYDLKLLKRFVSIKLDLFYHGNVSFHVREISYTDLSHSFIA